MCLCSVLYSFFLQKNLILRPLLSPQSWFEMTRHPVTLLHFDPVYAGVQDSTKGTIFDAYLMKGSSAMAELQNRWLGRLCYCQGRDTWDNIDTPGCREGLSLWYCYVDYESMMGKHHDLLKAWDDRTQWCHPKLWFLYVNNYMYIYIYIYTFGLTISLKFPDFTAVKVEFLSKNGSFLFFGTYRKSGQQRTK